MPFRKGAHPDLKRSEKADPEFCCSMSARESASAGIKRAWVISVAPANGKPAAAGRWNSPAPIPYLESWSGIIRQATRIALLRMLQVQGDGSTASTSAISGRRTKSAIGQENETSQSCSRYRQASAASNPRIEAQGLLLLMVVCCAGSRSMLGLRHLVLFWSSAA